MFTCFHELFVSFGSPRKRGRPFARFVPSEPGASFLEKSCGDFQEDVLRFLDHFSSGERAILGSNEPSLTLCGNNCYEWMIALMAAVVSGQKVLLLDPALPAEAILRAAHQVGSRAIVGSGRAISTLAEQGVSEELVVFQDRELSEAARASGRVRSFFDVFEAFFRRADRSSRKRDTSHEALLASLRPRADDDPVVFFMTSGTTSSPRLVGLSEKNLFGRLGALQSTLSLRSDDVFLAVLPLFHVYGFASAFLQPMYVEGTIMVVRSLSADAVTLSLRRGGVSILPAVPALWKLLYDAVHHQLAQRRDLGARAMRALLASPPGRIPSEVEVRLLAPVRKALAPTLRRIISGGARAHEAHILFFRRLGIATSEGYGLTESSGGFITSKPTSNPRDPVGLVGRTTGEVRIESPNLEGIGEVCLRGDFVFGGYVNANGLDSGSIDEEGFFHTGDLGSLDAQGSLRITGRIKDVIVLDTGKNVYPDDLELLYGHSKLITEICVVGVTLGDGERVCAVIHSTVAGVDAKALQSELDRLAKGLPSYQRIHAFVLSSKPLPRTNTRKFRRDEVRRVFLEAHGGGRAAMPEPTVATTGRIERPVVDLVCTLALQELPERFSRLPRQELMALDLERDLGLDSLARVALVCKAAEELGVSVDLARFGGVQNLGEACEVLGTLAPARRPSRGAPTSVASFVKSPQKAQVPHGVTKARPPRSDAAELYAAYAKPRLSEMLQTLGLNRIYHRGSGAYLHFRDVEGNEASVLDCVGGYGSTVLGHHHPEMVAAMREALDAQIPVHTQMAIKCHAGELAERLSLACGGEHEKFVTTFANSGAEAIEAALKHALLLHSRRLERFDTDFRCAFLNVSEAFAKGRIEALEWRGCRYASVDALRNAVEAHNEKMLREHEPRFLAARRSFHGKTMGALGLTYKEDYRVPFLGPDHHADFFDADVNVIEEMIEREIFSLVLPHLSEKGLAWEERSFVAHAALFLEPIQGEGGVLPMAPGFMHAVRELTRRYGVFFCIDEIQSGFFRTGRFLASEGIVADAYLLGKSMGGGLVKVSACLIRESLYDPDFGVLHTSTFAEDDFSSYVALRAYEVTRELAPRIRERGDRLKAGLIALQKDFPDVIREVRGEGLMLALEFRNYLESLSGALQLLSRTGFFNYVIAAHLLHAHGVRVAAPLSTGATIRIQPSVLISDEDMERLLKALASLCRILAFEDVYKLLEFSLEPEWRGLRAEPADFRHGEVELEEPHPGATRVGFLVHYPDNAVRLTEPSLMVLSDERLVALLREFLPLAKPMVVGSKNIRGADGACAHITFVALPFTASMFREDGGEDFLRLCREGAELLEKEHDSQIVGLGQYTSIITRNGTLLTNENAAITTGNAYTTAASLAMTLARAREMGLDPARETLAVIGAAGNIASMFAECFSRHTAHLRLLGSPRGAEKAAHVARDILWKAWSAWRDHPHLPEGELESFLAKTHLADAVRAGGRCPATSEELHEALSRELGEALPVKVVESLDEISACRIVVVSTNDERAFLRPEHFAPGSVVCDISVPTNCTPELLANDKGIAVIRGGVIGLPGKERLPIMGFPLKPGHAYACMTEALVLGLEKRTESFAFGALDRSQVETVSEWTRKHGFEPVLRSLDAHLRRV